MLAETLTSRRGDTLDGVETRTRDAAGRLLTHNVVAYTADGGVTFKHDRAFLHDLFPYRTIETETYRTVDKQGVEHSLYATRYGAKSRLLIFENANLDGGVDEERVVLDEEGMPQTRCAVRGTDCVVTRAHHYSPTCAPGRRGAAHALALLPPITL